jgi:hypothetical protein
LDLPSGKSSFFVRLCPASLLTDRRTDLVLFLAVYILAKACQLYLPAHIRFLYQRGEFYLKG